MEESCSESIWTQTSFMRHFITASTSLLVTYLYKLFSSLCFHFGRSYALKNLHISFSYSQSARIEGFFKYIFMISELHYYLMECLPFIHNYINFGLSRSFFVNLVTNLPILFIFLKNQLFIPLIICIIF